MRTSIENKPDPNKLLDWYDYNAREMPWRIGPKKGYQALDQTLTMFGYLKLCCSKPPSPPLSPTSQNLPQSGRQYLT